jgi:hypothetical protein
VAADHPPRLSVTKPQFSALRGPFLPPSGNIEGCPIECRSRTDGMRRTTYADMGRCIDRDYEKIRTDMQTLVQDLGIRAAG